MTTEDRWTTTRQPQRRIGRLSEIGRVATRHGFGYLIDRRRSNDDTQLADRGRRLREMLDELGPTFVKFGQLLSTRPDVMPPDIVAELRKLQDDVTPIPFADVRRVIEEELGPHDRAGVPHLRRDADRSRVDRPGAPGDAADGRRGRRQGAAAGGAPADRVRPAADAVGGAGRARARARPRLHRRRGARGRVRRSIRQELDYQHEARNAETFRRNFGDSTEVAVPKVIWRYSSARVLTLEFLEGRQFADLDLERARRRSAASSPTG